jgi:two-component system CheB/CheR fusion protein
MATEPEPGSPPTVIGIGASAGGLAALKEFFDHVPGDTGLVFVVIVHLAPSFESRLADLLQPHSAMPVRQVNDSATVEPDHVYVIPPGHNLSAIDTHLRLSDLEPRHGGRNPIDHFFRTLAATHDGHAIGIVLTGTGSDGTAGLGAITEQGGLAIAQDPEEAEYDGMPRSAVASGNVDLVLPLAEIANHVVRLASAEPKLPVPADGDSISDDTRRTVQKIFAQIRTRTGHDLSGYKETTLLRRIRRRMQLHQIDDLDEYSRRLRAERGEVDRLFDDLLISVTSFFRDRDVFEQLERDVIPRLFESKGPSETVRVWSVGCATGEEAYSLAILLLEHAATLDNPPHLQLFASDLHHRSLQRAREGVYRASIEDDISPEHLRRYFTIDNASYRIRKEVRETIIFAEHNLLKDPPFSHMDLIVCRNLLIYLRRDTQTSAFAVFHYALDPGGFLVLGTSETLDRSDLFSAVDKKRCFFRRRDVPIREPPLPVFAPGTARQLTPVDRPVAKGEPEMGYGLQHAQLLAQQAPPSILVDAEQRIVHYSTDAGRYLVHPGGEPTSDVFRLVHHDLRLDLRAAIYAARNEGVAVSTQPIAISVEGLKQAVTVRVVPATDPGLGGFVLVLFDSATHRAEPPAGPAAASMPPGDAGHAPAVVQIESELDLTRQRLQNVVEEYETSQEEMKAANEELQSTNEELRSTMEELETSKEELQSMNEELATLNQENRHKVEELAMLSSDLQNLLTATDIATLFLDRQLRIVRFTPPVTGIFNIVHNDQGRPLTDFTHRLQADDLTGEAQQVLDRLVPIERELQSSDGRWLLTRILPYRTSDDRIEGVVITFVDITRRLAAERSLRASQRRLQLALDASEMGSWSWDPLTGAATADDRALAILGLPSDDTDFFAALQSCIDVADGSRLRDSLNPDQRRIFLQLRANRHDDGRSVVIEINAGSAAGLRLGTDDGAPQFIGTIQDVTTRIETIARRGERQALLADTAAHLLHGLEPPGELVDRLLDQLAGLFDVVLYERYELDTERRLALSSARNTMGDRSPPAGGIGAELSAAAVEQQRFIVRNELRSSTDERAAPARAHQLTGYACYPLISGGEIHGVVSFGTDREGGFDEDLDILRTLVDCVAAAEQRRRAEADLRQFADELEAAVEERTSDVRALASSLTRAEQAERQRIAQLVHDDLQQLLHSAEMKLGLLREDHDQGRNDATTMNLDEIGELLDVSVTLARRLAVDLSPQVLDETDIGEILVWLAGQMYDMHGLTVDVALEAPIHADDRAQRVVLYQAIRELLFNVVKHAGIDRAIVELRRAGPDLVVEVSDQGAGFRPSDVPPGRSDSHGLDSIRQRIRLLGGQLDVTSTPEHGTRATIRCPVPAATSAPATGASP